MSAVRLVDYNYSRRDEKETEFFNEQNRYTAQQENFTKIPGMPVAYWVSEALLRCFTDREPLDDSYSFREGIHTADNDRFLRFWHEISISTVVFDATSFSDIDAHGTWVPYNKGGEFRKWYGNNEYVIGFNKVFRDEMAELKGHVRPSQSLYFLEGGTWSAVTSGGFGIRYYPKGFLFDAGGQVAVGKDIEYCLAYLNSKLFSQIAAITMPTINSKCGIIKTLPDLRIKDDMTKRLVVENVSVSKKDWDSVETSWDFQRHPMI